MRPSINEDTVIDARSKFRRLRALRPALLLIPALTAACGSSSPSSSGINVVAAENEYGSMVQAIGGKYVHVQSLLNNPNTDPHEFEASSATARLVAQAQLVIENGIGYDSWIDKLLSASPRSGRIVFNAGAYLGHKAGDNPHVWYFPPAWKKEAAVITADLRKLDPSHRRYFQGRERAWLKSLQPVYSEIAAVRRHTQGAKVIATEPVYGYMISALGATSLDASFQKATMDGTDPSPRSVAQFQSDLRQGAARMLFYNSQVVDPTTISMRALARKSNVPMVGVTETQPPNLSFPRWQLTQLRAVAREWK
jgi:zinc/manganese transport system substrate-binding protein